MKKMTLHRFLTLFIPNGYELNCKVNDGNNYYFISSKGNAKRSFFLPLDDEFSKGMYQVGTIYQHSKNFLKTLLKSLFSKQADDMILKEVRTIVDSETRPNYHKAKMELYQELYQSLKKRK